MGGGKSSTSTSTTTIPPEVLQRYSSVNAAAQQAASTPFQQYSTDPNAFVAPLNATQNAGIANTNAATNQAQPYYQGATGMTVAGSQNANLGGLNTNQYLSPYLNQVVGNTAAQLQNQNQQQSSALQGNAIMAGAFGGDRAGIAQGNLANQQSLANAQIISGLENTGYQQAQGVAQQQQGAQLSAQQANLAREQAGGAQLANIGNQAQTSALQGASAQLTAGQTAQQTQQAGQTALYNQFLQQQSYPFQVDQFLANIAEGTGSLSGSSTSTTQPSSFFSDRRLKEDIEPIGKTFDGQNIYKFRYKDKPGMQMGLMAQDVEKKHPHAVGLAGGYRTVDYDEATKNAAKRGHFRSGGLVPEYAAGGSPGIDTTDENPYGGAQIFDLQPLILRHLMTAQPVGGQKQPQNDIAQATGLFNDAKDIYGDGKAIYNGIQTLKTGGRAGYAGGGGPYDQLTGAAPSNENTPDYAMMTAVPPTILPSGPDDSGPNKPGTPNGQAPNGKLGSAAPVSTAPQTPATNYGSMDNATHGGMGNAANMRSGGRAGYDDGGGLPYQDDSQDDVDTPQYLKQKTGLNASGISIPDQQNTHGLMTAQNPTGAPTSGIGGVAQAANLAKSIYGLGSGVAGLMAPAATVAAPAAGLAGTAAAGAGTAAATGGGGILTGLLGLLPFLKNGGAVDRKNFDDGGDVGDDPNNPLSPFAHIGDPNYQQPGDADPGKPVVVAPGTSVDAAPAASATPVAPSRSSHDIAADVLSSLGTQNAAPAPAASPAAGNDNSNTGLVPDLPPAQYIKPQRVRPIAAEMAAPTGLPPAASATQDASVTPNGGNTTADQVWGRMIHQESGGQQFDKNGQPITSSAGAVGIAQVMPATAPIAAKLAGLPWDPSRYRNDPAYNAAIGRAYYDQQVKTFGDPILAAAAYNAGPGAVQNALKQSSESGGSPWQYLPAETQKYVSIVGNGSAPSSSTSGLSSVGQGLASVPSAVSGGLSGAANTASTALSDPSNQRIALSVLAGLGKMAGSNSRYLGSAILQGLGGGADAYINYGKGAADIGQTRANTIRAQQEANLVAAHTAQTQQETTNLRGAQYQRMVIPNDGTYVLDKSNPMAGMTKVADAQGLPIPGVSPTLAGAAVTAPLVSSPAAQNGNTTTPASGTTAPQQASGPQDLKPASINPTNWIASTSPPDNYQPGVQARYANYASDPAGGAQIRQQAIQDAAKLHDVASSAAQTQQNLANMKEAYQNLTPNQVGPLHDAYMKVGGELNSYTNALGLGNVLDPQAFASGQEVDKLHGALVSSMGGTRGAQLFADVAASVPGGGNTPLGFARVSASVDQMAQRTRDLSAYMDNYANKFGTLNGAQEAFDAQNPPEAYAAKAVLESVPPAAVQQLQTFVKQNPKSAQAAMKSFDKTFGNGTSKLIVGGQ